MTEEGYVELIATEAIKKGEQVNKTTPEMLFGVPHEMTDICSLWKKGHAKWTVVDRVWFHSRQPSTRFSNDSSSFNGQTGLPFPQEAGYFRKFGPSEVLE